MATFPKSNFSVFIVLTLAFVAIVLFVASVAGCAVTVDKRVWNFTSVHNQSAVGSASTSVSHPTTNTSDTKTDAQQAIDGALTIPVIP